MYEKKVNTNTISENSSNSVQIVSLIERIARIEEGQKNINCELLKINKHLEKPSQYSGLIIGVISSVSVVAILKILELVF